MTLGLNAVQLHVEIEGIREAIVTRIAVREKDLGDQVEAGLLRAVEAIDVDAIVQREAIPALENAVSESVKAAAQQLTWDPRFREIVYARVQEIIAARRVT